MRLPTATRPAEGRTCGQQRSSEDVCLRSLGESRMRRHDARRSVRIPRHRRSHGSHSCGAKALARAHPAATQSLPVWPTTTIEDCSALADETAAAWRSYLARLGNKFAPGSLDDKVEYRNSKGEPWSNSVADILTHVLFHSAYHRGQIALQMRASGIEPASTDFILAVRQGFVE